MLFCANPDMRGLASPMLASNPSERKTCMTGHLGDALAGRALSSPHKRTTKPQSVIAWAELGRNAAGRVTGNVSTLGPSLQSSKQYQRG